jgi:hypothetical protein
MVLQGKLCGRVGHRRDYFLKREERKSLPAFLFITLSRLRSIGELGEVSTELFCNEMFKAIGRSSNTIATTINLEACCLSLFDLPEVFFNTRNAVWPHCRWMIDFFYFPTACGFGTAKDRWRLTLFGPYCQPCGTTIRALAKLFPIGDVNGHPMHHRIVFDLCPVWSLFA